MKIGELARKSGFPPSTIRFYESAGLLPPALRHNGQRRFAADIESYLSVIAFARKAGFTLAEIKVLFNGFEPGTPASRRWRTLSRKKLRDVELLVARLKRMERLLKSSSHCRCEKLADCGRMMRSGHAAGPEASPVMRTAPKRRDGKTAIRGARQPS
jgi:DNA-binding transcriptional MerR regulator